MIYRGITTELGVIVKGYYFKEPIFNGPDHKPTEDKHWIRVNEPNQRCVTAFEIHPMSLAMETTVKDKTGTMIFGSIPVDGVMSKGGDNVKGKSNHCPLPVIFDEGQFGYQGEECILDLDYEFHMEITGSQWEERERNE